MNKTFWQIWIWPSMLGLLTLLGLLCALLGTGIWHWVSWITLSIPLIIVLRHVLQRQVRLLDKKES